jgi:DNA-binding NarL/FixJ family response regulator
VNPIVAAAADSVREDLRKLAERAQFFVAAIADGPASLDSLLRSAPDAWVMTGDSLALATPFMSIARAAKSPVVVVLAGCVGYEERADLRYGGLAVLQASPTSAAFRAAVTASRAGLNIWDPGIGVTAESGQSIDPPLSPRERTVLELTAAGLSTKAVARRLGISPNTVKFHVQAAFEKLGVTSRAEAVAAAMRRGELSV